MISAEEATSLARIVYFQSCFENVDRRQRRDTVKANSGSMPRLERLFGIQKLCQNMQHELVYPHPFP